jgi:hypothetical protein
METKMKFRVRSGYFNGLKHGVRHYYYIEKKGWFFWSAASDVLYLTEETAKEDIKVYLNEYSDYYDN